MSRRQDITGDGDANIACALGSETRTWAYATWLIARFVPMYATSTTIATCGMRRHSRPFCSRRLEMPIAIASSSQTQMSMMNRASEWYQALDKGENNWTE